MRASLLASAQAALLWLLRCCTCSAQRASVHQQHAQVAVTVLADVPEAPTLGGRILPGREAEPAGEVPGALEVRDLAGGGCNDSRGGKQPDAGDRDQRGAGGTAARQAGDSRTSCAMRASSRRTSSTSNAIEPRSSCGIAECGSASTRAICSAPSRAPCAIAMPNSRQKPLRVLIRRVRSAFHRCGYGAAPARLAARCS